MKLRPVSHTRSELQGQHAAVHGVRQPDLKEIHDRCPVGRGKLNLLHAHQCRIKVIQVFYQHSPFARPGLLQQERSAGYHPAGSGPGSLVPTLARRLNRMTRHRKCHRGVAHHQEIRRRRAQIHLESECVKSAHAHLLRRNLPRNRRLGSSDAIENVGVAIGRLRGDVPAP